METKVCTNPNCNMAGIPQPITNFGKDRQQKDGFTCRCKACRGYTKMSDEAKERKRQTHRRWAEAHPELVKQSRINWIARNPEKQRQLLRVIDSRSKRKRRVESYGITLEEYDRMLAQQNGVCAICGKPETVSLAIDHDHQTGAVRGLVCKKCNTILGLAGDSIDVLQRAIEYLERNPK